MYCISRRKQESTFRTSLPLKFFKFYKMMLILQILLGSIAFAAAKYKVIDLTQTLNAQSPAWPTNPAFQLINLHNFTNGNNWYDNTLNFAEHTGTHIDAPVHFTMNADSYFMHTIPVERLVCPLVLIDMKAKAAADRDYNVPAQDILDYEQMYGKIPQGSVVLIDFGWANKEYADRWGTTGTDYTQFHFPGISMEAGKILVDRGVYGYGADTPSTDCGACSMNNFPLHYYFTSKNMFLIESVGDMSALPAGGKGTTLIVGSIKTEYGSGGPARLIALVDETLQDNSATMNALSGVVLLLSILGMLN